MAVDRTGLDTVLAEIVRLLDQAQTEKPAITRLADRAASWFVGAVILIAAAVGWYWWHVEPDAWLPILISVLVVTCPCALSLATPTAISAATGAMLANGLLTVRSHGLETLARSTHVVFDKTGTLTHGTPTVTATQVLSDQAQDTLMDIAAALEARSEHPAGKALVRAAPDDRRCSATDITNFPGAGVSGRIAGEEWYIGNANFIAERTGADLARLPADPGDGTRVLLADTQQVHAVFVLQDQVRKEARSVVTALQDAGKQIVLLSGDNTAAARQVAAEVGITDAHGDMRPDDKLRQVQALQREGAIVVMVGDGINDAPVLAAADVSVAMRSAADISQASADMILMSDELGALAAGIRLANRTLRIIRQNLVWAASYNLIALPAAALGFVAPWMAAIGMSSSSLLVVLNALRLTRNR
jgi:Cu2+-exporting ATPase